MNAWVTAGGKLRVSICSPNCPGSGDCHDHPCSKIFAAAAISRLVSSPVLTGMRR